MSDKQETKTKVTVIRVAEETAWLELRSDGNGTQMPLAHGGIAIEHSEDERIHTIDHGRVPNVRPREVPIGIGKDTKTITVGLYAMRVLFISDPMTPEDALDGETEIDIDPSQVDASRRLIVPGNGRRG